MSKVGHFDQKCSASYVVYSVWYITGHYGQAHLLPLAPAHRDPPDFSFLLFFLPTQTWFYPCSSSLLASGTCCTILTTHVRQAACSPTHSARARGKMGPIGPCKGEEQCCVAALSPPQLGCSSSEAGRQPLPSWAPGGLQLLPSWAEAPPQLRCSLPFDGSPSLTTSCRKKECMANIFCGFS